MPSRATRRKHTLGLLHHGHILCILIRHTLHKLVHPELVEHACLFTLACRRNKILAVRIQKASEAAHERCPDLIRTECCRTHHTYGIDASAMRVRAATCVLLVCDFAKRAILHTCASIDTFVGLLIANGTRCFLLLSPPRQAVPFLPAHGFRISNWLHCYPRHNSRCSQSRLCVHRWCIRRRCTKFMAQRGGRCTRRVAEERLARASQGALTIKPKLIQHVN